MMLRIIVFEAFAIIVYSLYLKVKVEWSISRIIRLIAWYVLISLLSLAFYCLFTGRLSELFNNVLFLVALLVSSFVALWNN